MPPTGRGEDPCEDQAADLSDQGGAEIIDLLSAMDVTSWPECYG